MEARKHNIAKRVAQMSLMIFLLCLSTHCFSESGHGHLVQGQRRRRQRDEGTHMTNQQELEEVQRIEERAEE